MLVFCLSLPSPPVFREEILPMDKTYLKWYNKVGYGSGDIAGNVVYALLSSFVMIYLTDTVGLNSAVVGTLMLASKLFDGVSDIFFGSMIDKTRTRMGKARPWMFWGYFGCAASLVAVFAIPSSLGKSAQYAWFFIAYTLLNAVFYTANNIAYSALTALITKNGGERVQMGSIRFIFAFATSMLIQAVTVGVVRALGGGADGWRAAAIIYALIGLAVNSLSVFSVKELPPEEFSESASAPEEKYSLAETLKTLVKNRYYLIICCVYILTQLYTATLNMGLYFMTYALLNENLLGVFSVAINIPLICGLLLTPMLVQRLRGMYKLNLAGYVLAALSRALVIVAAYLGSVPLMLLFSAVASFGMSPLQGDLNALIASCSEYTFLTQKKRMDGTMYSCTSLGVKIGGGVGVALVGWLLDASGYVPGAPVQAQSCIKMLYFIYLWLPMLMNLLIAFLLSKLKVEQANLNLQSKV